jgi:hypothetical protein
MELTSSPLQPPSARPRPGFPSSGPRRCYVNSWRPESRARDRERVPGPEVFGGPSAAITGVRLFAPVERSAQMWQTLSVEAAPASRRWGMLTASGCAIVVKSGGWFCIVRDLTPPRLLVDRVGVRCAATSVVGSGAWGLASLRLCCLVDRGSRGRYAGDTRLLRLAPTVLSTTRRWMTVGVTMSSASTREASRRWMVRRRLDRTHAGLCPESREREEHSSWS